MDAFPGFPKYGIAALATAVTPDCIKRMITHSMSCILWRLPM
jgi:hypothetical protein